MAFGDTQPSSISSVPVPPPPPPRTLNVQKFAEARARELSSLHSIVSARLNCDFRIRRDKRRRTTGHKTTAKNHRRSKRRKLGSGEESLPDAGDDGKKIETVSRRTRRRMEFQKNPSSGFVISGDGSKRLRTHLWHAKRFTMVKRWGFYLPLGLHGRGRGSRALLRWFKRGALVHDASYYIPIELEGSEESISTILGMVLFPSPQTPSNSTERLSNWVARGFCYENALLYHVGAPISKFIAPVTYMWQPSNDHMTNEQYGVSHGQGISQEEECSSSTRKLWIWIHAAAYDEGFYVLNNLCQTQMHEGGANVRCHTLQGEIARLDVMGSKATDMLNKILQPISQKGSNLQVQNSLILGHMEKLPTRAILTLTVHDPRDLPTHQIEVTNNELSTILESDIQGEDLWSSLETNGILLSDSRSLWDTNLYPPIPESIHCKEKHDRRLKGLFLEPCNNKLYPAEKRDRCSKDFYLEPCQKEATAGEKDGTCRSCSILLLKHAEHGSFSVGWSIILPLCWVKVLWMSLVSHGFHPIGLRERRWVASNNGVPHFPSDFPDCEAYSSFMADEAAAFDKASELRPPAMRPLKVPIPPPWSCIASTFIKGPNIFRECRKLHVQTSADVVPESPTVSSDPKVTLSSQDQFTETFPGLVLRASEVLDWYLQKIGCRNLLRLQLLENGTPEWITSSANVMDANRKLCFIRVLLHAHKEGVFEEGAVICAPLLTDLSRWTSRSGEEDEQAELQLPQSSLPSCFAQQESGGWELLDPKDPLVLQSFRWPVGFVTTGFVYGSSKPVAVGFCEARLLAMLRVQQQSSDAQQATETEISVYVRNMRSTAYRRAKATIVLEQQQDDIMEFM